MTPKDKAPSTQQDDNRIPCAAGCKRTVEDMDDASAKGWSLLPITNRWRCPQCWRELQAVNKPKEGQP